MYKLKDSGVGKKWCGDEVIILSHELSQRKLKKLFSKNCEFVTYEQTTTSEETEISSSTAEKNTSVGSSNGRKPNTGKRTKKSKAD